MELKEGMYVRTKDGIIDKVIIDYNGHCNNPNCNCKHVGCKKNYYDEGDIIKASHNIIDLIEIGDYVNGYEVVDFDNTYFNGNDRLEEPKRLSVMVDRDKCMGFAQTYFKNEEIQSVLTKEQFEQVVYIVRSDNNDN